MLKSNQAILKTLLYADIFSYPLTYEELWTFLISEKKISKKAMRKSLNYNKTISFLNGYYFLKGNNKQVKKRILREKISIKKIKIACKASYILSFIQTISFIGISGSLAMKNATWNDDIDFFIIVKPNTIWFTRILALAVLQALGLRRKRVDMVANNKICLNMFISEEKLLLPIERHNLFSAHEIAQLMPLYERNNIYSKFLKVNSWVTEYMPHVFEKKLEKAPMIRKDFNLTHIYRFLLTICELISKPTQQIFINLHKTTESISDSLLAFHPFEYKNFVLHEYNKRLKNYKIH